jgi:hypothetical protein
MIDFQDLKKRVDILKVCELLGIELKKGGEQYRGRCVMCDVESARPFVVTPAKSLFYCFACSKGGDQLALYAEVKKVSTKVAAEELSKHFSVEPARTEEFEGLKYLDPAHPSVIALGFTEEFAARVGIGHAGKGILRGRVAIPIRDAEGALTGYIGIGLAMEPIVRLPPRWY